MKKIFQIVLPMLAIILLGTAMSPIPQDGGIKKISKKVDTIIQAKCYGCHSNDSKAEKAKNKLNWDNLLALDDTMAKEKMEKISKVLMEGSMPPKGMLEKKPEMKLTDKEVKTMSKWSKKSLKKLSK